MNFSQKPSVLGAVKAPRTLPIVKMVEEPVAGFLANLRVYLTGRVPTKPEVQSRLFGVNEAAIVAAKAQAYCEAQGIEPDKVKHSVALICTMMPEFTGAQMVFPEEAQQLLQTLEDSRAQVAEEFTGFQEAKQDEIMRLNRRIRACEAEIEAKGNQTRIENGDLQDGTDFVTQLRDYIGM